MTYPRVTVLMTVYGTEREFLKEAIESILQQTLPDFKFLIVNDGDPRAEIRALLYAYALKDHRVFVQEKMNTGLTGSLNWSMPLISTPYIMRQDADDLSRPERMAVLLAYMDSHPKCGAVGDNYAHVDETGKIVHVNTADPMLVPSARYKSHGLAGTVAGGGVMLRRQAVREVGGWKYPVAQDCYMWHAMRAKGWELHSVQRTLYHWRKHSGQITVQRSKEQQEVVRAVLREFEG